MIHLDDVLMWVISAIAVIGIVALVVFTTMVRIDRCKRMHPEATQYCTVFGGHY